MLYISGLYALNLPCKLHLQGDRHLSSLDFQKVEYIESKDSIFGDYGIEVGYSNEELGLQHVNKANYIRACLDLLEQGEYSVLKTFMSKWLDTDLQELQTEIFNQVLKLSSSTNWNEVDDFMDHEYLMKWVRFKQAKVFPICKVKAPAQNVYAYDPFNQDEVNNIAEQIVNAYLQRDSLYDLNDLIDICGEYRDLFTSSVRKLIVRVLEIKGAYYVEYLVNTQFAPLIDNQALADYFIELCEIFGVKLELSYIGVDPNIK